MPRPGQRAGALLGRIRSFIHRRGAGEMGALATPPGGAPPRWPHLVRGWLDPDVPLNGWRTTVELTDVEDVLRAVASASDGRFGDAEIAEVLEALAHTGDGCARAFRFGRPRAFTQLWIGLVPSRFGSAKIFLLGDLPLVESVEKGVSVAGFASAEKRAEYQLLRRFFIAAWKWQWTSAPFSAELRATGPKDFDPSRTAEAMERVLSNPHSPFLELLRGLRRRALDLLEDTRDLDRAGVEAADAHLARSGAPTLSEMRSRYRDRPTRPS